MVRNTPSPFGPALSSLHPFPSHTGGAIFGSFYVSIYSGVLSRRQQVLVGKGRRPRPVKPTGFRGVGGKVAWRAQWDASGTDFVPRARVESAGARAREGREDAMGQQMGPNGRA